MVGETLNEEVALLLGVLEALLLTKNLSLTRTSGKGWLNIEPKSVNFLVVEVADSLLSALRAVVFVVLTIKADESKRLLDVFLVNLFLDCDGLDLTVSLEDFSESLHVP